VGTQESIGALRTAYSHMEQILSRTKKMCHELGAVIKSEQPALVTDTLRIRVFSRRLATIRLILHGFADSVMADLPASGGRVTLEVRQEQEHPLTETNSWCSFGYQLVH